MVFAQGLWEYECRKNMETNRSTWGFFQAEKHENFKDLVRLLGIHPFSSAALWLAFLFWIGHLDPTLAIDEDDLQRCAKFLNMVELLGILQYKQAEILYWQTVTWWCLSIYSGTVIFRVERVTKFTIGSSQRHWSAKKSLNRVWVSTQ